MLPGKAQWPSHNYNHLMEQPTVFYAVALTLALVGWGHGLNTDLAWGYAGLRIAHSLVQATFNRVAIRFAAVPAVDPVPDRADRPRADRGIPARTA